MDIQSPDLLQAAEGRFKRQTTILAVIFALFVISLSAFGARWSYLSTQAFAAGNAAPSRLPVISDMRHLFFGDQATAAVTPEDATKDSRLNILILGIGGAGHDGSNLTDTILLASVDLKEKRVGIVSIPRDLAYPLGSGRFEKINSVHAYAEQNHPGEGAVKTAEAFSELFETKIDHVLRIDFRGFEKLIDAVGGVSVNVETAFTDGSYPSNDPPNSWQTVSFKKGVQQMSGARALIYARSRHGNNGEGSDFARSRRQQIVILALRDKLTSLGTLTDPSKLADIYRAINSHVQSDLSVWDLLKFAPIAGDFSKDKVTMNVLSDAPKGLLASANVNGAYMLFPKQQDWSAIRTLIQDPYEKAEAKAVEARPQETIRLEMKNGTFRTNFAAQVAAKLEENGYEIPALGNATKRGFERSSVYDLTGGKKPAELARLQRLLNADVVSVSPNQIEVSEDGASRTFPLDATTKERVYSLNTDFLVILGEASFAFVEAN